MKIILFNGPPRSGKDTAALRTIEKFGPHYETKGTKSGYYVELSGKKIHFDRFAMPLKSAFAGVTQCPMDKYGNVEPYESIKGEIIPWLGVSYRQWQIDFSEKYMKPMYGKDIFARLFVQRNIERDYDAIVVPDSGFIEEAQPVIDAFGFENTILVRVHRPGFDFTGDARSYLPDIASVNVDVYNGGEQSLYEETIDNIVGDFLAQ